MRLVVRVDLKLELGRQVMGAEHIQVSIQHFAGLPVGGQFQAQRRYLRGAEMVIALERRSL